MKNLILTILLSTLFIANSFGQVKPIADFYKKYQKLDQVHDIKIQGWLLKMAASFSDEDATKTLLKKITYLRALIMDDGNLVSNAEQQGLIKSLKKSAFEPLMEIRDGNDLVNIMIRENGEYITDALILVHGDDDFILLSIEGKLKFSDLNDLQFEIDGTEHFKKVPEQKSDVPRA